MDINSEKKEARHYWKSKRNGFYLGLNDSLKTDLVKNFFELVGEVEDKIIGGYYPIDSEIDCLDILTLCQRSGAITSIPYINSKGLIDFRKWSHQEPLVNGAFNIPTSKNKDLVIPDIIILPLLSFDKLGTRLGMGSGIYDRSLPFYNISLKIGLAFSGQISSKIPKTDYDHPLDAAVTEKKIYRFNEVLK